MISKHLIQKISLHFICITAMYLITAIYFSPAIFDHKVLDQSDIKHGKSINRLIYEYNDNHDDKALWNPAIFSGTPTYIIGMRYPSKSLKGIVIKVVSLNLERPANLIFLGMLFTYIMLVIMKCHPLISLTGAIIYGFCSFNMISIGAGHNSKVRAAAFIPIIFAGITLLRQKKYIIGLAMAAVGFGFSASTGHFQIVYYALLAVGVYYIVFLIQSIKDKSYTPFLMNAGCMVVAGLLGLFSNIDQIWPVYEYGKHSIRGERILSEDNTEQNKKSGLDKPYAFSWSNGIMEPMTLLIPRFYGGGSREEVGSKTPLVTSMQEKGVPQGQIRNISQGAPMYWGPQPFTEGPIYASCIAIFLFVLGCFVLKKKEKTWMIAMIIFFLMLSWGDNFKLFNYAMFDYFPFYNKFRTVAMTMIIVIFAISIMGSITLQRFISSEDKAKKKKLIYAFAITGGICAFFILFAGILNFYGDQDGRFPDWLVGPLMDTREELLRKDAFISLFFIGCTFAGLLFYTKGTFTKEVVLAGIAILVTIDIWRVNNNYLNKDDFVYETAEESIEPTPANQYIMKDTSIHYRVFDPRNPLSNSSASAFHYSLGGYHPAKMRRYQDLGEHYFGGQNEGQQRKPVNQNVLHMLNAKYVLSGPRKKDVQRTTAPCGAAWFINNLQGVASPDEEIASLENFKPKQTAFFEKGNFPDFQTKEYNNKGRVNITSYSPNKATYTYESDQEGFIVFSEVYYPHGWKATIDGESHEHIRVNYTLRGMEVPAGKHDITFTFKPAAYHNGVTIAMTNSYIIFALFIGALFYEGRKYYSKK